MKSNFLLLILLVTLLSCDKDKESPAVSQETLLTNDGTKKWKLIFDSSDSQEEDVSCTVAAEKNIDNRMIFTKGGDFDYDNGTITEDCEECSCGDWADLYGNWTISNGVLTITAKGRVDDGVSTDFDEVETLLVAKIRSLTKDELVLENPDDSNQYIEFAPTE